MTLALINGLAAAGAAPPRPNIVFILADDMGWGTGQFNNPDSPVATPNLNALAAGGINFTRSYSATVCSPTRSMLYTGFHTGHGSNDRNGNINAGLRPDEVTVGELLKTAGYETSVFGKWGWGGSQGDNTTNLRANPVVNQPTTLPAAQGFDTFYGYLNHTRAHSYFIDSLWSSTEPTAANKYRPTADNGLWLERTGNSAATPTASYSHDLIAAKAEQYVATRAGAPDPFLMMVNYTIPHQRLDQISSVPGGLGQYASNPNLATREKEHAAMISRMDASIGALVNRLSDPNGDGNQADSMLANTLIIFSSDNGPAPEGGLNNSGLINLDLTNGLRGGKRDLYEGGIRTPLLVRWDAAIGPERRGTTNSRTTDLTDFIATAAELAGDTAPLGVDGVSLAPTLTGQGFQRDRDYLLSENFESSSTGNTNSDWSLIRGSDKLIKFRTGTFGLYNLATDPFELAPLNLGVAANNALKVELEAIALAEGAGQPDSYFVQYARWVGVSGGSLNTPSNWNVAGAPQPNWTAVVKNSAATPSEVVSGGDVSVLALEVSGDNGSQSLRVDSGHTVTGRNEVRVSAGGRLLLAGGTVRSSRWIDVYTGGQLEGAGKVQGDLFVVGSLAPGSAADSTDRIEVQGQMFLLSAGAINLELGGSSNANPADIQFDQVLVTAAVQLDGAVNFTLANNFVPAAGQTFDVIIGSNLAGEFSSIQAPQISSALTLRLRYLPDRVQAVVAPAIAGDFNADGHVDAGDYTIWRDQQGQSVSPFTGGDATGDGQVEQADYDLWRQNFGQSVSAALTTPVPEASSLAIVLGCWGGACSITVGTRLYRRG